MPSPPWNERADRKSTRLNSSHLRISYAVFFLKKTHQMSLLNWYSSDDGRGGRRQRDETGGQPLGRASAGVATRTIQWHAQLQGPHDTPEESGVPGTPASGTGS